jgi:Family of unknown function (DUF5706)
VTRAQAPTDRAEEEAATAARELLRRTHEEVGRADSKAATLLAGVVVAVTVVATSALGGHWTPLGLRPAAQVLWWLATGALACTIVLLCTCIYPSVRRRAGSAVIGFFGDAGAYPTGEALRAALSRPDHAPMTRLADQLFDLSRIVRRKYLCIRVAFWGLAACAGLTAISLVVNRLPI